MSARRSVDESCASTLDASTQREREPDDARERAGFARMSRDEGAEANRSGASTNDVRVDLCVSGGRESVSTEQRRAIDSVFASLIGNGQQD